MTFGEFFAQVRERTGKWFHNVEYCTAEVIAHRYSGAPEVEWRAYTATLGHASGPTPEAALAALDERWRRHTMPSCAEGESMTPDEVEAQS